MRRVGNGGDFNYNSPYASVLTPITLPATSLAASPTWSERRTQAIRVALTSALGTRQRHENNHTVRAFHRWWYQAHAHVQPIRSSDSVS